MNLKLDAEVCPVSLFCSNLIKELKILWKFAECCSFNLFMRSDCTVVNNVCSHSVTSLEDIF